MILTDTHFAVTNISATALVACLLEAASVAQAALVQAQCTHHSKCMSYDCAFADRFKTVKWSWTLQAGHGQVRNV